MYKHYPTLTEVKGHCNARAIDAQTDYGQN